MAIKTTPRYDNDAIKDELSKSGKSVREITPSPNFLTILENKIFEEINIKKDVVNEVFNSKKEKLYIKDLFLILDN